MRTGNYFIVHPDRICISKLFLSLIYQRRLRSDVLESPDSISSQVNENWRIKLSLVLIKLIKSVAVPLAILGTWIEFLLNLLSQNGGVLKTLFGLLNGEGIDLFLSLYRLFIYGV